jgi:SAC3 family protein LENG8/THP3
MPTWHAAAPPTAQQPPVDYGYTISELPIQPLPFDARSLRETRLTSSRSAPPAYTAVQTRQTFGQPYQTLPNNYPPPPGLVGYGSIPPPPLIANPSIQPAMAHTSADATPKKVDWPESVRNYVQRAFQSNNLDPNVTRKEMEQKLKETISKVKDSGDLHSVDWDSMPLPQQLIKAERAQALQSTASMAWLSNHDVPSKKRKSGDITIDDRSSATPPWRDTPGRGSLGDRITFASPDRRSDVASDAAQPKSKFQKQKEKRQKRFDAEYKSAYREPTPEPPAGPIIGTSEVLEKRYLRLTAPPNPANVRPERVLRQTLELLKSKWRKENNYGYICDQFKSMRQDLTVQRIRNDFTVSVYEIHARIALEKGDLGEYNQCQTQLRALYQLGLKGNPIEFKAYRILYFIYSANRGALNDAIADLTAVEKQERAIKHALDVRSALALGNYHRFFQLYLETPNMGAYLMDMFVVRERLAALAAICKV